MRVHTVIGRETGRDVYQDPRDYVWNSTGDTATLRDTTSTSSPRSPGTPLTASVMI
ncbi:hypothetical protein ACWGLE_06080 [Streptomyces sp. NPDC055897]